MASRPKIPAAMQKAIKEEAGYRCAIPTCRDKGPFDFEHIDEWSKVKKHEEHNIILLCVTCHARVTRGEIQKSAIKAYKRNLAIISGRYSLYETRILEDIFRRRKALNTEHVILYMTETDLFHVNGLLHDRLISFKKLDAVDGLLESWLGFKIKVDKTNPRLLGHSDFDAMRAFKLVMNVCQYTISPTQEGIDFVEQYFSGKEIS